jgi:hypothetical protein
MHITVSDGCFTHGNEHQEGDNHQTVRPQRDASHITEYLCKNTVFQYMPRHCNHNISKLPGLHSLKIKGILEHLPRRELHLYGGKKTGKCLVLQIMAPCGCYTTYCDALFNQRL